MRGARDVARMGVLLALILILGLVERQFPLVPGVPGIRLGLSNAVVLYALIQMGARYAWTLTILKAVLGGLLYAGVSGMLYSLGGGALAMLAMTALLRAPGMGFAGVSVAGACAHALGQVLVSRPLLGSWAAAAQTPLLLVASVAAGIATGLVCQMTISALSHTGPRGGREKDTSGGAKE